MADHLLFFLGGDAEAANLLARHGTRSSWPIDARTNAVGRTGEWVGRHRSAHFGALLAGEKAARRQAGGEG